MNNEQTTVDSPSLECQRINVEGVMELEKITIWQPRQ